jgi:hypothetical protein
MSTAASPSEPVTTGRAYFRPSSSRVAVLAIVHLEEILRPAPGAEGRRAPARVQYGLGVMQPRSSIMATPTMLIRPMPAKNPAESTGTNLRHLSSPTSLAK